MRKLKAQKDDSVKIKSSKNPVEVLPKKKEKKYVSADDTNTAIFSVSSVSESQMTPLQKMHRLNAGISKRELQKLKDRTELDYTKLARLLSVTRATLINKASSEKFNSTLSERIFGLADIYSYGYEVFEDEEKFNLWMFKPNRALDGKTPYEICNNQFGREEVKNIIGRIDYGVYS